MGRAERGVERLGARGMPRTTSYGKGRVCRCGAKMSMYNPNDSCHRCVSADLEAKDGISREFQEKRDELFRGSSFRTIEYGMALEELLGRYVLEVMGRFGDPETGTYEGSPSLLREILPVGYDRITEAIRGLERSGAIERTGTKRHEYGSRTTWRISPERKTT